MPTTEFPAAEQLEHLKLASAVAGLESVNLVLPEDHVLDVHGLKFHLVDWGNKHLPTVLFLHGAGLTCRTWDLVCLSLRDFYHCVAVDMRGHGDTDWSSERAYSITDHAEDVAAVVESISLDNFILVGHSMGGMSALKYAGTHHKRLRGLVLVDTGPGPREHVPSPADAARPNPVAQFMAGPAELDTVEDFVERALEFNPARDKVLLRRSLLHNLKKLPNGRWTWKYDRDGLLNRDQAHQASIRRALWDDVPNISCPTLVVRGARSELFTDERAEELASNLPKGRWHRIENAGHTVQGDNPKGLVEILKPFLEELDAG